MLRPVDVVVMLRLALESGRRPLYSKLALELGLYPSEVYTSLRRCAASHFLHGEGKAATLNRTALLEFLHHGVRYAFPAQKGSLTRGVPTAFAAPPLNATIVHDDVIPVWPYPLGQSRGYQLTPLHKNVPEAALKSPALYELLALVDSIRDGKVRERQLAAAALKERLTSGATVES
jgi:hypothetical protein